MVIQGSVVQLLSGSPPLTVERVGINEAVCMWFNPVTGLFASAAIDKRFLVLAASAEKENS